MTRHPNQTGQRVQCADADTPATVRRVSDDGLTVYVQHDDDTEGCWRAIHKADAVVIEP